MELAFGIGFALMLAATIADLWTTRAALKRGAVERNPAVAWILGLGGFRALAVAKWLAAAITLAVMALVQSWWLVPAPYLAAAAFAWAAWGNHRAAR